MAPDSDAQRTYDLDREHVFHSWSAQKKIEPMVITKTEGSFVWDGDGNKLIDFASQLVYTNIGHQHPVVIKAIQDQAADICTVAPQHAIAARSEAARLIAERTPGELNKIFFTNGGADANEHAVRMARLFTGRNKVLTRYRSYHGGTTTAITMTGDPRRWPNDLGTNGTVHFFGPFLYRSQFHASSEEEECARALEHLEQTIFFEGADTIAAIVLESIPGTAGVMVPPPGYLAGVRELCTKHGIIMISDEVMTGFGRTGAWFGIDHDQVVPDLLTFAKGVNSGYVPLGGVAISPEIYDFFGERAYPGGLTYSGHPLASAAASATIRVMAQEGMVENAARLGTDVLGPRLAEMERNHPSVGEVRGRGAMWALDLVKDPATKEPLAPYGGTSPALAAVSAHLRNNGVLPFANFNRVHVLPPLNVADADLNAGLDALDGALSIADEHVGG